MKRLLIALAFLSTSFGVFALLPAAPVAADAQSQVCAGVNAAGGGSCADDSGALQRVVNATINIFSIVIGIVAVIMIMVGGFNFVTAGGDSSKVSSARATIAYAIVGLIIAAFAQALVKFVLKKTS